jgi:hypothetical protein
LDTSFPKWQFPSNQMVKFFDNIWLGLTADGRKFNCHLAESSSLSRASRSVLWLNVKDTPGKKTHESRTGKRSRLPVLKVTRPRLRALENRSTNQQSFPLIRGLSGSGFRPRLEIIGFVFIFWCTNPMSLSPTFQTTKEHPRA